MDRNIFSFKSNYNSIGSESRFPGLTFQGVDLMFEWISTVLLLSRRQQCSTVVVVVVIYQSNVRRGHCQLGGWGQSGPDLPLRSF